MKTNQLIKNDKRLLIYQYILKHPYLHLCELVRELNIPKATLTYHLRYLEKNDLIISNHEGRYVRYSITNSIGNAEKKYSIFLGKIQHVMCFFIFCFMQVLHKLRLLEN